MAKLSLDDLNLSDKNILVRVDFNIPIQDGEIVDNTRIIESLPTIKKVLSKGACYLASHLGRPKGRDQKYSLKLIKKELETLLNRDVNFIEDIERHEAPQCRRGQVFLFENLRFYEGEESNDSNFASILAKSKDVYVNEAFSASHRQHASVHAVARYFKSKCAGYLLNRELKNLDLLLRAPKKPFMLILGGAKVRDKVPVIKNLIDKVDAIMVGGAAAFTFLAAQGKKTGNTLVDKEALGDAGEILKLAKSKGVKIILPCDAIVSRVLKPGAITSIVGDIPDGYIAGDIGPKTIKLFETYLKDSKTVFWNGPMGIYEIDEFSYGTREVASVVADLDAFTVAGGGDVVAAINSFGIQNGFKHISTGGGACLELLSGLDLPGLSIIPEKK